jgi:Meiotic cell cortex C-terminal pleckstrin homology
MLIVIVTIQSVLDVKDDNPMPKGSTTVPHFNRSILILTPERALKFTALTRERHYVWLTALSFLSHSPLAFGDLATLPPPPVGDIGLPPPSLAGSLRRRPIRDSIRIAKGAGRTGLRSFTTDGSLPVQIQDVVDREQRFVAEEQGFYDPMVDAALPPTIPRFSAHTRKRSNTAPRAPPSSFKSFSIKEREGSVGNGNGNVPSVPRVSSTYSQSVGTGVGSERGLYSPSLGMKSVGSKSSSRRGSEASAMSSGRPNQGSMGTYVDSVHGGAGTRNGNGNNGVAPATAAGGNNNANPNPNPNWTMRMDAFIENRGGPNKGQQGPSGGGGAFRSRHSGKKKDLAYWGVEEGCRGSPTMGMGMENILLPGDVFGSTRMGIGGGHGHGHGHGPGHGYGHGHGHRHGQGLEVEVGAGGDPFRGF